MELNFEIEDNIALNYQGRHIDLHNNFDFIGYGYNTADRSLKLTWTKASGDWIKENEFTALTLIHSNVFFLIIGYDNLNYEYPKDDNCLSDITFFPSSERQSNDSVILQAKPTEGDDIIYIFESQHFIRVGCSKIDLLVE